MIATSEITATIETKGGEEVDKIDIQDTSSLPARVVGTVMSQRSISNVLGGDPPAFLVLSNQAASQRIDLTGLQPPEIESKIRAFIRTPA